MSIVECVAFYVSPLSLPWHLSPPHPLIGRGQFSWNCWPPGEKRLEITQFYSEMFYFIFCNPNLLLDCCVLVPMHLWCHTFSAWQPNWVVCVCVCGTLSHHWVIVVLSCLLFNMFFFCFWFIVSDVKWNFIYVVNNPLNNKFQSHSNGCCSMCTILIIHQRIFLDSFDFDMKIMFEQNVYVSKHNYG